MKTAVSPIANHGTPSFASRSAASAAIGAMKKAPVRILSYAAGRRGSPTNPEGGTRSEISMDASAVDGGDAITMLLARLDSHYRRASGATSRVSFRVLAVE
jgi:hypothetical protein